MLLLQKQTGRIITKNVTVVTIFHAPQEKDVGNNKNTLKIQCTANPQHNYQILDRGRRSKAFHSGFLLRSAVKQCLGMSSPIDVVVADDVIFIQVRSGLDFNHFQRQTAGVLQPMLSAQRYES